MTKAKKEGSDAYLALLDYPNMTTQGLDTSLAQRLMSRSTKTLQPTTANLLQPQKAVSLSQQDKMLSNQVRQGKSYDRGTRALLDLEPGDTVRMHHGSSKTKNQELLRPLSIPKSL